jgi:RHS repeat-associated protein
LAREDSNGVVVWSLSDSQGSVRDVINGDGVVLKHINYDAFGNQTSDSNPNLEFRFGYTGRELDEETGNYYYRSRYYDSTVGRFISEDSIGFEGGDANLYRYVGNGSVNGIDPYGTEVWWNNPVVKFLYDVGNNADQFAAGFGDAVKSCERLL